MLKKYKLTCILILSLFILTSCSSTSSATDQQKQNDSLVPGYNEQLFRDFLQGKVIAKDKNNDEIRIEDYFGSKTLDSTDEYALYDMNHDGLPELHVRGGISYLVFTVIDKQLVLWHDFTGYDIPLNNGAVLYSRDGAAPKHVDYQYSVFDFYGNETLRIGFSKYSSNDDENYDTYFFNDGDEDVQIASKTDWDKLTRKLLSIKSDKVEWHPIAF
ncbi:hypothetical protein H8B09_19180 [Paenibacillus sp. PR3]|uniref:Uncharacterized protein n=2 Tax=Paenibacillus terricola TaxID=2763503 RepID=A0ABR8MYE6_9BACL|nr:hypothetical protein [Paenibacillus terricola]